MTADVASALGVVSADLDNKGITNQYGVQFNAQDLGHQQLEFVLPAFPPNRGGDEEAGELPTETFVNFGCVAGGHNLEVNGEPVVPDNVHLWP